MTTGAAEILSADDIAKLLIAAFAPGVHGVALVGSVARGDAGPWSDIDAHAYVRLASQKSGPKVSFMGDRLLMIATQTVAEVREELRTPARALWAVPAVRDMRILLDQERQLAALKQEAEAFEWASLREEAERSERDRLAAAAEYVLKIRGAIEREDEGAALHAAGALVARCTRAVVTARGVLIRTENEYYRRARETAGPEWTELHRRCFGLAAPGAPDAFALGRAAAALYAGTLRALDDLLDERTRAIASRALGTLA